MKNIFDLNPNPLITKQISDIEKEEYDNILKKLNEFEHKYKPQINNIIIEVILFIYAILNLFFIDFTILTIKEAQYLIISMNFILIDIILLSKTIPECFRNRKTKKLINETKTQVNEIRTKLAKELEIPENVENIDIFAGEEIASKEDIFFSKAYINYKYLIYKEGNSLYFSDYYSNIKLPISKITSIEKKENKIIFLGWNKNAAPGPKMTKEYRVKKNFFDDYSIKKYYEIKLEVEEEEYFFIIPAYDIEILERLLPKNKQNFIVK